MNGYPYQSFGNNYGGFNNSYNGYTGYGQTTPYQQPVVQPPKTNKIFVTSLDEALSRPAEPNTEIVYLHQNEPLLFQITTDLQGKKTFKSFQLTPLEQAQKKEELSVLREDFEELKRKVNKLFEEKKEDFE